MLSLKTQFYFENYYPEKQILHLTSNFFYRLLNKKVTIKSYMTNKDMHADKANVITKQQTEIGAVWINLKKVFLD